jgi:hypothetical protein
MNHPTTKALARISADLYSRLTNVCTEPKGFADVESALSEPYRLVREAQARTDGLIVDNVNAVADIKRLQEIFSDLRRVFEQCLPRQAFELKPAEAAKVLLTGGYLDLAPEVLSHIKAIGPHISATADLF